MAVKLSRPVLYGGVLLLGVAGFIMSNSSGPGASGGPTTKKAKAANGVAQQFDDHDYKDRFARLTEGTKDAFTPLVARREGGMGGSLAPNEIPAAYTGGEAGWLYTGTVVVDDVPSALLENEVTGDFHYLKVGEKLNRAMIAQIAPTYIVVNGAAGQTLRLELLAEPPEAGGNIQDLGVQPVRPNVPGALRGPIGGPVAENDPTTRNAQ